MIQDPNPTDYPHLEAFIDWLYEHVEELPPDIETLKTRLAECWLECEGDCEQFDRILLQSRAQKIIEKKLAEVYPALAAREGAQQ